MTDLETLITEIVDRILKAEPDKVEDGEQFIEKSRIVRIVRGLE